MVAGSEHVEVDTRENNSVLTILSKGNTIHYTIPSFPVYSAEVKVQWEDEDGSLLVFDAFARNCDLLNHQLPAIAEIPFSYDNAFIIEVRCIFQDYINHRYYTHFIL